MNLDTLATSEEDLGDLITFDPETKEEVQTPLPALETNSTLDEAGADGDSGDAIFIIASRRITCTGR